MNNEQQQPQDNPRRRVRGAHRRGKGARPHDITDKQEAARRDEERQSLLSICEGIATILYARGLNVHRYSRAEAIHKLQRDTPPDIAEAMLEHLHTYEGLILDYLQNMSLVDLMIQDQQMN